MNRERMIERILDVLAPLTSLPTGRSERIPIFEWGHETTPIEAELQELAGKLVDALSPIEGCSTCGDSHPGQPCAAVEQPSAEQKKIEQLQARVTEMHKTIASTSRNAGRILADAEQLKRDHELFQLAILHAVGLPMGTGMAGLLSKLMEKHWTLEEIKAAWLRAVDGGPAGTLSAEDFEKDWLRIQKALMGEEA